MPTPLRRLGYVLCNALVFSLFVARPVEATQSYTVSVERYQQRVPARLVAPDGYHPDRATSARLPLVVLLHGFTASGRIQDGYFGLSGQVASKNFLLLIPEGTPNSEGKQFWNATDWCCDLEKSGVDDSGYLRALIDTVEARFHSDPERIYLFGHSNGGFMANRLACDDDRRFAAIFNLAGSTWKDPSACENKRPLAMLSAHGTADTTVLYAGCSDYPSVEFYNRYWAKRNECQGLYERPGALNLSLLVYGPETDVVEGMDCAPAAPVVNWRLNGIGHIPLFRPGTTARVLDWLLLQRRP